MTSQPPFCTGDIGYQLRHNRPQYMYQRLADLELNNDIPSEVSAMVMACLAKERGETSADCPSHIGLTKSTSFSKPIAPSFVPEAVGNPVPAPLAPVAVTVPGAVIPLHPRKCQKQPLSLRRRQPCQSSPICPRQRQRSLLHRAPRQGKLAR